MSVVACFNCFAVEHGTFQATAKFQVVVPANDLHSEEIKKFFAATPTGSLTRALPKGDESIKAGDRCYLILDPVHGEPEEGRDVVWVFSLLYSKYQTTVGLHSEDGKVPWEPWRVEMGIRNEVAAEQFDRIGKQFYVALEPVPANG